MADFKLTVIGDSFAEGRGDPRPDGSFGGWVPVLGRLLGIAESDILNLGAFGATAQEVVDTQLAVAQRNPAPVMGVTVGGNDLVRAYTRHRFRANVHHLLSSLLAPGRTVFTITFPDVPGHLPGIPSTHRDALRRNFTEANADIRRMTADLGVPYLDLAVSPITADDDMWNPDGIHPSAEGHRAIGAAMAAMLRAAGLAPVPTVR
jgi:lysophospholipase L1-like esterase